LAYKFQVCITWWRVEWSETCSAAPK